MLIDTDGPKKVGVDPDPAVALRVEFFEEVGEFAFAGPHHRRQHLKAGAFGHDQHLVDDLLRGLPLDRAVADRAVRAAGPSVPVPGTAVIMMLTLMLSVNLLVSCNAA